MNVLIVDASAVIRSILRAVFEETPDFTVVGEASNGQKGVEQVELLHPDVVVMDMNMPIMNGLEATREIMGKFRVPVCIFSNEVDSDLTVQALGAGALDAIRKPELDQFNDPAFLALFLDRLRGISRANTNIRTSKKGGCRDRVAPGMFRGVVVGASTGGPAALKEFLGQLPANFPLGIALVQHMEEKFDQSFAQWLDSQTSLHVRLARDGDTFQPGQVLVAPGGKHLVCREGALFLDDGPKVGNQKPAVDRLFETAATTFRQSLVAVLLTGMGADGATGAVQVKNLGGYTVIQDEATSAVFGMPKAAIELGAACTVLPLDQIASHVKQICS